MSRNRNEDHLYTSIVNIGKRRNWAKDNLKTDFSKVLFTDESRVKLDVPYS